MSNNLERFNPSVVALVAKGLRDFGIDDLVAVNTTGETFDLVLGEYDTLQYVKDGSRYAILCVLDDFFIERSALQRISVLQQRFMEDAKVWVGQNISCSDKREYSDLAMGMMLYDYEIFHSCYFVDDECNEVQLANRMFVICRMDRLSIKEADMSGVHFRGCQMAEIVFSGSKLKDVVFINCKISAGDFKYVDFENVRFLYCNMVKADFSGAKFLGKVEFRNCNLTDVTFNNVACDNGTKLIVNGFSVSF